MKRIIIYVMSLVQYSIETTILHFEPMHAAPPISRGRAVGISLGKRQECPFGVVCGGGCTILGPCCDEVTGFSCRDAETCVTINGQLGCCPVGTTCTIIKSCLNASDPTCVRSASSDSFFCCDNTAPFCNTLGTAQVCQATEPSSSSAINGTVTAATQPSTAPKNSTIALTTAKSTTLIESTATTAILSRTSAVTQQLIATNMVQSFHPLNSSSTSTKPTVISTSNLTRSELSPVAIATTGTIVTVTPEASVTSVTHSVNPTVTRSIPSSDTLTSLGNTLQLHPTRTTTTPIPIFTGGSNQIFGFSGPMIATFGFLLGVLL